MGFDPNDPILETGHDISRAFASLRSPGCLIASCVFLAGFAVLIVWAVIR